jgi:hypothetical protein
MTKKTILLAGLIALFTPCTHASYSTTTVKVAFEAREDDDLPLHVKEPENAGEPNPKSLFPIPKIKLQGNTLHFITPCNGSTFRLVQNENICYEVEIMGNTLTIPGTFTGTYELQIVSGEYIFYTDVTL